MKAEESNFGANFKQISNQFHNIDNCSNQASIRPDDTALEASANFAGLIDGNCDSN